MLPPPANPRLLVKLLGNGYYDTFISFGSLSWALHDMPGYFDWVNTAAQFLLSQQDPEGTWVGELQTSSIA